MSGWKTFLFNGAIGLVALLGELLAYFSTIDWKLILPPEQVPFVLLGIGAVNILLRHVTTGRAAWRKGQDR